MTDSNPLFTNNNSDIVASDRVLYTASSFARSSLLHLQEIGELVAKRSHTSSRSGLQSFLFFVVISGSGNLTYDGKNYTLSQGSCVFINCKTPYSHTTADSDLWKLRWIHFFGPTLSSIYDKYCERGGRPAFSLSTGELAQVTAVWNDLMTIAKSSDHLKDMRINEQLGALLTLIMEQSWHPEDRTTAPKRALVVDVKSYIDEHYNETISLDDLSNRFYIDKYYLTKTFRSQFGLNISTYIRDIRITKAKQLLRFSDKTVEEIGYEVGIGNPAYFSRVFKEVEGVGPKKYREQW